jgi:hypothetical protein
LVDEEQKGDYNYSYSFIFPFNGVDAAYKPKKVKGRRGKMHVKLFLSSL